MWFDQTHELLGSSLRITFEHSNKKIAEGLLEKCWERIRHFHNKYSRFLNDNALSQINSQLNAWQKIDQETYKLIDLVQKLEKKYPLNFSLAVKTTLENMGYDQNYSFKPKKNVQPTFHPVIIKLKKPSMLFISDPIEFGGFGKGYALDLAAQILESHCKNLCLDFGGDLYAQGKNPKSEPWKIALESPFKLDEAIGTVIMNKQFLTASNTLKRRWKKGKMHHLIDVKNQKPADYWEGSYVMADSGITADLLATGLFCTSPEDLQANESAFADCHFMLVDKNGKLFQQNFQAELF